MSIGIILMVNTAFVALGSNLNDPTKQLKLAIYNIEDNKNIVIQKKSSVYLTKPLDGVTQENYLNMVIKLDTSLSPIELLDFLQSIESKQGRVRSNLRFSARNIDLDILLFSDMLIKNERLTIPHYDLVRRDFFVIPLFELEPSLNIKQLGSILELKDRLSVINIIDKVNVKF